MALNVVHSFLKCIGKFLDDLRILFHITFFCAVGCVRHISGCFPKRRYHITCPFFFQDCGRWFKLYRICRRIIPCESRCRRTKIDTLVDGQIFLWVDAIFLQNIFKYHFRHATFSSTENFLSFQIFPFEIRHLLPSHKEVSGPLGKLGKVYCRVGGAFLVCIDRCFRSHETDICLTGNQSCQNFICAKTSYQCQVQTFLCKISLFNRHILRRIENRMRYLI